MAGVLFYSSNNSGGSWWLDDSDWFRLEKAGWNVEWYADKESPYHGSRWLGALAAYASKEFKDVDEGVDEWSSLTGQNPGDQGCNCCGPPHNFRWEDYDGSVSYGSSHVVETELSWS